MLKRFSLFTFLLTVSLLAPDPARAEGPIKLLGLDAATFNATQPLFPHAKLSNVAVITGPNGSIHYDGEATAGFPMGSFATLRRERYVLAYFDKITGESGFMRQTFTQVGIVGWGFVNGVPSMTWTGFGPGEFSGPELIRYAVSATPDLWWFGGSDGFTWPQ